MNDREARDQIVQTIASSKYRWRTAQGIATDLGLPIQRVIELLERSDAFVRARKGNSHGDPLYTTSEKYRAETSISKRILGALTNKISE